MWAKKSLGQNFLISPRITENIALSANLQTDELVLEIGPGKGALTKELLRHGAKVLAVEKDDRLIPLLEEMFASEIRVGKLTLIHGDILEIQLDEYLKEPYKLVANIPYYITGELLRLFLSRDRKPEMIILMVQKEISDRLRDTKESILSLAVKAYGNVSLVTNVSRGNFFPIPNVDSAVIKIDKIKNPFETAAQEKRYFELVKTGFAHKRKKLISNLEKVVPKENLKNIFKESGLSENSRPEEIKLETWINWSNKL
jgi:16S rRNA (adenine1518-N6/adenine1519-N6)-dimethyltransferase